LDDQYHEYDLHHIKYFFDRLDQFHDLVHQFHGEYDFDDLLDIFDGQYHEHRVVYLFDIKYREHNLDVKHDLFDGQYDFDFKFDQHVEFDEQYGQHDVHDIQYDQYDDHLSSRGPVMGSLTKEQRKAEELIGDKIIDAHRRGVCDINGKSVKNEHGQYRARSRLSSAPSSVVQRWCPRCRQWYYRIEGHECA
jgi:hypothetical protein